MIAILLGVSIPAFAGYLFLCFRCLHSPVATRMALGATFLAATSSGALAGYLMINVYVWHFMTLYPIALLALGIGLYQLKDQRRWFALGGALLGLVIGFYAGFPWSEVLPAVF